MIDARTAPADPTSAARLGQAGYDYRVVDVSAEGTGDAFGRAMTRGFLHSEPDHAQLQRMRESWSTRRSIGVFPRSGSDDLPVATVNSWVAPMTVPGGEIPMWAISGVTVAATHRRRGISRALLEGELRSAFSAGVPIAGLTASEATIYSRYGFGPAVPVASVSVDTRRAGWIGAEAPGRVEYVEREQVAADLEAVHERSRGRRCGQIPGWEGCWRQMSGLGDDAEAKGREVRGVRYLDAAGVVRGVVAYMLEERPNVSRFDLRVHHLAAETDEALCALWGFLLNHDLVERVLGDLRPVDDPLPWLVADQRAVELTVHDNGWLRVLDVPAALIARSYRAPLDLVMGVDDAFGFADGIWRMVVDGDGRATVTPTDAALELRMGVVELSAIYAGGVPAATLAAAGRIHGEAEAITAVDDAFRTAEAPQLGILY